MFISLIRLFCCHSPYNMDRNSPSKQRNNRILFRKSRFLLGWCWRQHRSSPASQEDLESPSLYRVKIFNQNYLLSFVIFLKSFLGTIISCLICSVTIETFFVFNRKYTQEQYGKLTSYPSLIKDEMLFTLLA